MKRFLITIASIALLATLGGCATSPEARQIRSDLVADGYTDLKSAAVETEALIVERVQKELDTALAELWADYQNRLALAADTTAAARITADYMIGVDKTKKNADAEIARLMVLPSKIRGGAEALKAANRMADAEVDAPASALREFRDSELPALIRQAIAMAEKANEAKADDFEQAAAEQK